MSGDALVRRQSKSWLPDQHIATFSQTMGTGSRRSSCKAGLAWSCELFTGQTIGHTGFAQSLEAGVTLVLVECRGPVAVYESVGASCEAGPRWPRLPPLRHR